MRVHSRARSVGTERAFLENPEFLLDCSIGADVNISHKYFLSNILWERRLLSPLFVVLDSFMVFDELPRCVRYDIGESRFAFIY